MPNAKATAVVKLPANLHPGAVKNFPNLQAEGEMLAKWLELGEARQSPLSGQFEDLIFGWVTSLAVAAYENDDPQSPVIPAGLRRRMQKSLEADQGLATAALVREGYAYWFTCVFTFRKGKDGEYVPSGIRLSGGDL